MKNKHDLRSSIAFLATFLGALLLFGGITVWVLVDLWNTPTAPQVPDPPPTVTTVTPRYQTHRLLLITEEAGEAQGFVALSAEPALSQMQVIPIPRETVVTTGVSETRLFEMYATGDLAAVTATVSQLLGWEDLTHYAVITYANLRELVTYLNNGVIFTLTEDISYQTEAGVSATLRSGVRTLTAHQVTDILNYRSWHGGRRARADMQGYMAAAILNQYFTPSRLDEEDHTFRTFITLTRSNILVSDYAEARADLLALARRNDFDLCTLSSPAGEFIGVGEAMRFEPSDPKS